MKNLKIHVSRSEVESFCMRWKIVEFAFFGSVLRDDFTPQSDVDILVQFDSDATWGLFDLAKMEEELAVMFHRSVDLVSKKAIQNSHNWIRKQNILGSAEIYYAA